MDKVSVVICTHASDRLPVVRDAIASLRVQTVSAHELIVVVDHNEALLSQLRADHTDIKIIENHNARGLSGARNCGAAVATGSIVAFLDDDALAAPDWVERLRAPYQDQNVLAVGGHAEPAWPDERPAWWPEEFDWVIGCSYRGLPETPGAVRNLIGCNMSVRRIAFKVCGGFSANLGRIGADAAGCEETEFFIRAQTAFPLSHILYDPAVKVRHQIAPDRVSWAYFAKRCRAEGRSKAMLASMAGAPKALETERAYVRHTLPHGVVRGLFGGLGGLRRAGTIAAGLVITASGYFGAKIARHKAVATSAPPAFSPFKICQFDLAEPIGELACIDPGTGRVYGGAFCLVRDAGVPVGIARFPTYGKTVSADVLLPELALARSATVFNRPKAPDTQLPSARVVVATRDRPAMLAKCLDTLLAQSYPRFEIQVVDSAPATSATRELIAQRYAGANIRYTHEPAPGLGLAHNRGIAGARVEILAFTDDDVLVDPDWLAVIGRAFARDDNMGCVTGLILPAELETRAQWWIEAHGGFGKGFDPSVFDLEMKDTMGPLFPYAAGAFGSGANMAFSRRALEAIGGFDPALGAGTIARGGDDLAAFTATILAGFRLAYEPGAIVWHHHRRNEDGIAGQAYGYGVGLGAYLTKMLLDNPWAALAYARGVPAALRHVLSPGSPKNARLPSDYPAGLKWAERRGMLAGFSAYLRSRRAVARRDARSPSRPTLARTAPGS